MIQVLWLGPPDDTERPDEVVVALKTPRQALELAARLKNEAEHIESTGKPSSLVLSGRLRK